MQTSPNPEDGLAGLIERVTSHHEETVFAVLRVKVKGRRELATVGGSLASVTRGVPVIKVRVAASWPANTGVPVPILVKTHERAAQPEPEPPRSSQPKIAPPIYSLECGEENFREPEDGELLVGIYREDDGTPVPLLLWADPNVDLFWDVARREHVKPPRLYLKLSEQPEIDPVTGFPVIQGAVCPF